MNIHEEREFLGKLLNEGSYYDFIAHYVREIEDNLKRFRKLTVQIEKESEGKPEGTYEARIEGLMKHIDNIYDKPVAGLIDRLLTGDTSIDVKEVADVALDINNRYGTEMRQVVNAMDDVLGPVHEEEIDEVELAEKKVISDDDYTLTDVEELGGAGYDNIIVTVKKGKDTWNGTLEKIEENTNEDADDGTTYTGNEANLGPLDEII